MSAIHNPFDPPFIPPKDYVDVRESTLAITPDDFSDITLTRNRASYNADGTSVAANEKRYTNNVTYFPRIQWIDHAEIDGDFIAGGLDYDGTTPLIITHDSSSGRVRCYRGEDISLETNLNASNDLMLGTVSGETYFPRGFIIHHGLIVALAERRVSATPVGVALLQSTDYCATWTRIVDVGGDNFVPVIAGDVSSGMNRGQPWSFTAAFPVTEGSDLTNVFVPWADYIFKADNPKGGQAGMFRAYRATDTTRTWTVEPTRTFLEIWDAAAPNNHVHAAAPNSIGMVTHVGDTSALNCIYQTEFDTSDYQNASVTTTEIIFGGFDNTSAQFSIAPQPVGTAPGPTFNSHLASGDESWEVIQLFGDRTDSDDDLSVDAPIFSTKETGLGTLHDGWAVLDMQYCYNGGWASVGAYTNDEKMALISRDGTNWGCVSRPESGGRYIVPFPDYLLNVQNDGTVSRANWPSPTTAKALDIKCGSVLNKCQKGTAPGIAQATAPGGTSTSQYVEWDGDDWVYVSGGATVPENDELKAAGTPPFGTTFKLIRHAAGTSRTLARTWMHNSGNGSTHNLNTAGNVHVMSWMFIPASQRQGCWHTWKFGTDGGASSQGTERGLSASVNNQWIAYPHYFDQSNLENDRPWVAEFCPGDSALSNGLVHYTLFTHVGNGIYGVSYPSDVNFVTTPDEDAYITLPSNVQEDYTMNLTLYIPRDIFFGNSRNPIVTFWEDANNYIEITLSNSTLQAESVISGSSDTTDSISPDIYRDQFIDIALTKDSDDNMKVLAYLPSMDTIQELDLSTCGTKPTEIRFANADKSAYQPIAVMAAHYLPYNKTAATYNTFVGLPLKER